MGAYRSLVIFRSILVLCIVMLFVDCGGGGGGDSGDDTNKGDTIAPASGSISINSGASSTTSNDVTLTISATDGVGVTGYYVSENSTAPTALAAGWLSVTAKASFAADVSFSLTSGDGTKSVYIWFKDAAGNVSYRVGDSIIVLTSSTAGAITGTVIYVGAHGPVSSSKPIIVMVVPFPGTFDAFVSNGTTYQTAKLTSSPGTFTFADLPAGQYQLAMILDVSNDGVPTVGDPCKIYTPGNDVGSNNNENPAVAFTISAGQLYTTSPNNTFLDNHLVGD